jgi:tetratricopeptide (TPR) repeat protein/DNA-binding winged helix-turn-helix (wHTH) protein
VTYRIRDANLEVIPRLSCLRQADGTDVYVRPKTFQTLLFLLEHRDRVVSKDDLARQVWPDVAVTDDTVVQCIVELRKLLGDDAKLARFIRTLPRNGYRFVGEVEVVEPDAAAPEPPQHALSRAAGLATPPVSRWLFRTAAMGLVVAVASLAGVAASMISSRRTDASNSPPQVERHTIAVMSLDNQSKTEELDWLRDGLGDMLVTGLSRSGSLSVVGRQQLEAVLDRTGQTRETPLDFDRAKEVARRAHLDYFVLGSFSKLGSAIRIDLRLHTAAGALVNSEALTVEKPDDLLRHVDLLGWRIAQHFGGPTRELGNTPVLTNNLEAFRYYSMGVSKANASHSLEAIKLFTRATELDPEFSMAFARIGYAYGVTWNHVERARPYLAKAYQLPHRLGDRDRLQVEAWNALVHLDFAAATTAFTKLIAAYPADPEAYARLGLLLAGERRNSEALDVLRRGLAVDPESGDLWNRLGSMYDGLWNASEAIAARQKYVALQPAEPNAHDSLGLSYQGFGRYDEAIASYQRALELKPDFEPALVHLGNAYAQTGRYRAAEELFRRYIRAASSEQEITRGYLSLARLAQRRGRLRDAVALVNMPSPGKPRSLADALLRVDTGEHPRIVAEFQPTPEPSRGARLSGRQWFYAQGMLALKRGDAEDAIGQFRIAIKEPRWIWDFDPMEDCLANAFLKVGRFDDAIAEYERVLQANPRYPLAHYRLGLAFERKDQPEKARGAYAEFLRVWSAADREIPELASARSRLSMLH